MARLGPRLERIEARLDAPTRKNGHSWGVSTEEINRQWHETPMRVAERAREFLSGELDPDEHVTGIDMMAKAVLIADDNGGNWDALPEWMLKEFKHRRSGLGQDFEERALRSQAFHLKKALEEYQRLEYGEA